ncbi:MAG: methyl-accepting chemotaxis protein [Lachnospiraceae bacterium]|nr:methyl-accepting chemotaxis protein [Lachnospiraceae bacterium]
MIMNEKKNTMKKPTSENTIFRYMMIAVFTISSVFFLKNLLAQTWTSAVVIGICLFLFTVIVLFMKKIQTKLVTQQFILCLSIVFLVFIISLNSGSYYSDDFPLYLSVIALSGLYLVPKYALVQLVLIDILLALAYVIHPEKADPLGQYVMCMALFSVCSYIFYMVIKRGRAYIELGKARAEEAELLIEELKKAGIELQENCDHSVMRIAKLEEANGRLETSAAELQQGSSAIISGTMDAIETFTDVQERMLITEKQIESLNDEVKKVEISLSDNQKNMKGLTTEMESLKNTISATNEVFNTLQKEILEISAITDELAKIAHNTTTLSLNASIEAARAGQAGAGFQVVASKVHSLADDSNSCSSQVVNVVNAMKTRIDETSEQLTDSTNAINSSIRSINELESSFLTLTSQFNSLYQNIEAQNGNVQQMDAIIEDLKGKISDVATSSETNHDSVNAITDAIIIYRENIDNVMADNRQIHNLSSSLLELSHTQIDLES